MSLIRFLVPKEFAHVLDGLSLTTENLMNLTESLYSYIEGSNNLVAGEENDGFLLANLRLFNLNKGGRTLGVSIFSKVSDFAITFIRGSEDLPLLIKVLEKGSGLKPRSTNIQVEYETCTFECTDLHRLLKPCFEGEPLTLMQAKNVFEFSFYQLTEDSFDVVSGETFFVRSSYIGEDEDESGESIRVSRTVTLNKDFTIL